MTLEMERSTRRTAGRYPVPNRPRGLPSYMMAMQDPPMPWGCGNHQWYNVDDRVEHWYRCRVRERPREALVGRPWGCHARVP